jgi:hypothetical protein
MHHLLARTLHAIERQVEGMAPEDLERHPPGKWSAAGILEHLAITFDGTRRNLQKCVDTGTRRVSRRAFRQRLAVLAVIELGRFPTGVQAPARTMPTGLSAPDALAAVRRNLPAMDRVMLECEAQFGTRRPIADHPILGPLTLRQWRRFHWVHTRHHMKQVAALRKNG